VEAVAPSPQENCGDGAGGGGGGLRRRIVVLTSAFLSSWPFGCHEPRRGSQLLGGFPDFLLVGSGRILHNTAVEVT
jgi:hypothetical protein